MVFLSSKFLGKKISLEPQLTKFSLIRRSDCQSASIPAYNPSIHNLDEYWLLAIEAEQKRRYYLLIFVFINTGLTAS